MSLLKISSFCSGIGSPEFAMDELSEEMNLPHEIMFACEINKFARASYLANFKPKLMIEDMTKDEFNGPEFYSDINVSGLPCQSFSLAGLRKGELDPRGLLFYDFYRYVKNQQPKAFVIENVKSLLSDSNGKTFQNWLLMLGDSVNGHMQMFNHELSLGYNLHWTVLNTKDFGIPQNRERVFLVGIRPDLPNTFRFPVGFPLKLRLKDILEPVVDEKYYLSDKFIKYLEANINRTRIISKDEMLCPCILANQAKTGTDSILIKEGEKIRRLTPLELWRFQGFSDNYFKEAQKINSDHQLMKQAGNSMTTKVVKGILKNILNCIFEVSPL